MLIVFVKNKTVLCIVDYYSKLAIMKKADCLEADDLVKTAKIILAEFGLPKNCISDESKNLTSDIFR